MQGGSLKEEAAPAALIKEEAVSLKEEPVYKTNEFAALSELYADHFVKDELAVGPEILQSPVPADAVFGISTLTSDIKVLDACKENENTLTETNHGDKTTLKTSLVKLEDKMLHKYDFVTHNDFESNSSHTEEGNLKTNKKYKPKNSIRKLEHRDTIGRKSSPYELCDNDNVENKVVSSINFNQTDIHTENANASVKKPKPAGKENKKMADQSNLTNENDNEDETNDTKFDLDPRVQIQTYINELNTCELCEKIFTSQSNLTKHQLLHTGQKLFTCKICNKQFVRKDYLLRHEKIHSKERQYTCQYCFKTFADRSNFNRHKRFHKDKKLYTCEVCGKQFQQRNQMLTHQLTHKRQKPYSCSTCLKQFTYKHRLTAHKRIHTGIKPYRCQLCPKRYIARCRLTRHEVLVHAVKRPYICDVCEKEFKTKDKIIKHITNSH